MKLYDKKFLIYGNCMIRSFGQPGMLEHILLFLISKSLFSGADLGGKGVGVSKTGTKPCLGRARKINSVDL